jgi:hypothetical protein
MNEFYFLAIEKYDGEVNELVGTDCHTTKSVAGSDFYYDDKTAFVTVTDRTGFIWLHLDKDNPENNVSVPSSLVGVPAEFRFSTI